MCLNSLQLQIIIMETAVLNLQSLYEKLRMQADLLNENIEPSE